MLGSEQPFFSIRWIVSTMKDDLHWSPVMRTQKSHALLSYCCQFQQRDHLEPTLRQLETEIRPRIPTLRCRSRYCSPILEVYVLPQGARASPDPVLSLDGKYYSDIAYTQSEQAATGPVLSARPELQLAEILATRPAHGARLAPRHEPW